VNTLLRVERLDHDTVDASKRARGLGSVLCRPDTILGMFWEGEEPDQGGGAHRSIRA
jgi:hypothetical protein